MRWLGVSFYSPYLLLYLHRALGLGFVSAGLVISGLALLAPPLSLLGGGLADRWGRRRMIVASMTFEALALTVLATGLSLVSLPLILAGLGASQVCSSVGVPSTLAYVADRTTPAHRSQAIAWIRIGINLGYSGGIALGGVLLLFLAFWETAAIATIVVGSGALVSASLLPPSPRDRVWENAGTVPPGTPPRGWVDALVESGRSTAEAVRSLRRNPFLIELGLAGGLSYLMFQQLNYSISTFGLKSLGISYGLVGGALAVNGITCVLLPLRLPTWAAGRTLTWVGACGAGVIGTGLFGIGLDGFFRVATVPIYFLAVLTMSVGECFATLPPWTLALNLAPEAERGAFSGGIAMSTGLVASLSGLFAGAALSIPPNPIATWSILSAPAIVSIGLYGRLGARLGTVQNRVGVPKVEGRGSSEG